MCSRLLKRCCDNIKAKVIVFTLWRNVLFFQAFKLGFPVHNNRHFVVSIFKWNVFFSNSNPFVNVLKCDWMTLYSTIDKYLVIQGEKYIKCLLSLVVFKFIELAELKSYLNSFSYLHSRELTWFQSKGSLVKALKRLSSQAICCVRTSKDHSGRLILWTPSKQEKAHNKKHPRHFFQYQKHVAKWSSFSIWTDFSGTHLI